MSVSIHAPVWGANKNDVVADCVVMFQSTHPCGVRMSKLDIKKAIEVSIHAPVWGAKTRKGKKCVALGFNPRTRVGCEARCYVFDGFLATFQSTHPCGVRKSNNLTRHH